MKGSNWEKGDGRDGLIQGNVERGNGSLAFVKNGNVIVDNNNFWGDIRGKLRTKISLLIEDKKECYEDYLWKKFVILQWVPTDEWVYRFNTVSQA